MRREKDEEEESEKITKLRYIVFPFGQLAEGSQRSLRKVFYRNNARVYITKTLRLKKLSSRFITKRFIHSSKLYIFILIILQLFKLLENDCFSLFIHSTMESFTYLYIFSILFFYRMDESIDIRI